MTIHFKVDRVNKFYAMFNDVTGEYMRSGVMNEDGDTGVDPFMTEFPELIDVGIMGWCKHGQSGLCIKAGVECYQNGLGRKQEHMLLADFKSIVDQCKGKTFQLALGGRGDVDQHPDFEEIMAYCRENKIAPNFTTSGLGLTDEHVKICKEYAGAVAVSWYRSDYTIKAIERLMNGGVKTNIHYVLGNNTIDEALDRLQNDEFPHVNAIIFLMHKPVGLGEEENVLNIKDQTVQEFFEYIDEHGNEMPYKIGFDSCAVPALVNLAHNISPESMDTCEAGRWSCYITPDMKLLPCSFDNEDMRWAVDLRTHTIKEAWDSNVFESFRDSFRDSCPNCNDHNRCMSGCPIVPQIVMCDRPERILLWGK